MRDIAEVENLSDRAPCDGINSTYSQTITIVLLVLVVMLW